MAQNTPNLTTILLGGGGLITLFGGYAGFVIKTHIDSLNVRYETLFSDKEGLQRSLTKAEEDLRKEKDKLSDLKILLESIEESKSLSAEDAVRIKKLIGDFQRITGSGQEEFEEYKVAADWLKYRKSVWVKEASNAAFKEHRKLFTWRAKAQFQQDIAQYLEWVYTSLYVYGHPDSSLSKFVLSPKIKSSIPYIAAIYYLKSNRDRGNMTLAQSTYLEDMLGELIAKIDDEFKKA